MRVKFVQQVNEEGCDCLTIGAVYNVIEDFSDSEHNPQILIHDDIGELNTLYPGEWEEVPDESQTAEA